MVELAQGVAERNAAGDLAMSTQVLIFGGMFMGFGIKVPMFPFHTWLPDAHTQAPTQGSVILAAVLLKLGTYGFIRVALPILPEAAVEWAPYIGALAVIGIIYGALGCLAQTDMKRLIAFSSVAHMGFVMLGIASLTTFGLNAAVFGMVAHGLITGMLFFVAGSVKERFHTLEIKRLGGLLLQAPQHGLDPRLLSRWRRSACPAWPASGASSRRSCRPTTRPPACREELFRIYMVIAAVGTVLAAGYLLWLFQRTAFGEPEEEFADEHIHDVHVDRVDRLARRCSCSDPRARRVPGPHLQRHRPGHLGARRHLRGDRGASGTVLSTLLAAGGRRSSARTSTTTRSRPSSSSPARSCVVLLVDLFTPKGSRGIVPQVAGIGAPRRRSSRCSPWPSTAPTGRCSAAPTRSTTSRSC